MRRGQRSQSSESGHARGRQGRRRGPSRSPLRRSTRLNPDLASTSSLEERSAEAESSREQSRRRSRQAEQQQASSGGESSSSQQLSSVVEAPAAARTSMPRERSYRLELTVQPPAIAAVGTALYPPPVVRVHIHDAHGDEISGEDELSNLFAQATLYRESGNPPPLAPPDVFLLSGRLSRSLDLLNEPQEEEPNGGLGLSHQVGSYVLFPDLTINRPGRYRLGVSLFKVEPGRPVRPGASSSATGNSTGGGGMTLEEVKSNVIEVRVTATARHVGVAGMSLLFLESRYLYDAMWD